MQIHELNPIQDFDQADYAAVDNGTATRKIDLAGIINTIKNRLGIVESDIGTAKTDISGLKGDVSTLQSGMQTANANISTNTENIGTLQSDMQTANQGISDLRGNINNINNTTLPAMQSDIDGKVSMTDAFLNLDTTQASTTTDGALYAAITALGWESEVIESA